MDPFGVRRLMSCGTKSKQLANRIMVQIDLLVTAKRNGLAFEGETVQWLQGVQTAMRERLQEFGLLGDEKRPEMMTLGGFLDDYFSRRSDIKPSTRTAWGHTVRNLKDFFGSDKPLVGITAGAAADFERFLKAGARVNAYAETEADDSLSAATIRKRIGNAKAFFQAAVEYQLIDRNPFEKFKTASPVNRKRSFFITNEMTEKLIDAAPDSQWRLLIALCRWGGLRNPSETLALRWDDINWDTGRMLVRSSKTEHHEGGESRWTPIFPELRPYLDEAWELLGDEPALYVIHRYRSVEQNLRTQFLKIIKRAGLAAWPKLFINLRSSRATELRDHFPSHVCAAWLGHTEAIADRHYRQVTDEHFEQAILYKPEKVSHICRSQIPTEGDTGGQGDEEAPIYQGLTTAGNGCHSEQWSLLDSNQ